MFKRILLTCTLLLVLITGGSPAFAVARSAAFTPPPPWPGEVSTEWIEQHQTATLLVSPDFARQQEARALAAFTSVTAPDPRVTQMLAQVTTTQIYSLTGNLSGEWPVTIGGSPYTIATRWTSSGTPIQKATQYTYEYFSALGLPVEYHTWTYGTFTNRNVVATLTGSVSPDEIILVVAHLDSVSNKDTPSNNPAPGADDNASGSVGVLLAAEFLRHYTFERTIRFVLFTGEEQGLYGSRVYAEMAYNRGDNILAVYNMDMIAYNTPGSAPVMDLHTRVSTNPGYAADRAIADTFVDVVQLYGLSGDLQPEVVADGITASDHSPFWQRGYPAILAIEDWDDFTPHYHYSTDRLHTLNMPYYTAFVKASLGTAAHLGLLVDDLGSLEGHVTDASTTLPISATVTATGGAIPFVATTDATGYYTLTLPVGAYTVTAETALYGYTPAVASGVQIFTDTVTPLDLALQPYPRHTVSGVIRDIHSGLPLAATISTVQCPGGACAPHTYASALSDAATGAYTLTLLVGDYTLEARASGYQPAAHEVQVAGPQMQDFALAPRACLLLVDDDHTGNAQVTYQADLDALGTAYATWNVYAAGSPSQATLDSYRHVLWLTGNRYQQTLTATDQTALSGYLDGGGNLLLSSWGVGSELQDSPFLADYLRAVQTGDLASGVLPLAGQGIFAGRTLTVTATAALQVSKLTPRSGATRLFNLPAPHTTAAAISYAGQYRLAYLGFGLEMVSDTAARQETLATLLDWLGPCPVESAPVTGFISNSPVRLGQAVVFTNTTGTSSPTTYAWDFGDGVGASTAIHPAYTYTATGAYTVTLTATNAAGSQATSATVEVLSNLEPRAYLPLLCHTEAAVTPLAHPHPRRAR